ncbi:MAG: hypothetical protein K6G85_00140 [Eubacterium sp.]|nr:hypothetical protein [Eubacterium sp.]
MAKKKPITNDEVIKAEQIRREYRDARKHLDQRVIDNEKYWQVMHNEAKDTLTNKTKDELEKNPKTVEKKNISAWLFNSVINTHADYMDNFPEPYILPREESDRETAVVLNKIVPTVMKYNKYERTYSQCAYDKTKSGTSVTGVFWDNDLMDGMGDVAIREIDILNIDWEPKIDDIQESNNIFISKMVKAKDIEEMYDIKVKGSGRDGYLPDYEGKDYYDESDYVTVVDWYYKKKIKFLDENHIPRIKTLLHLCRYCEGNVLFASENMKEYVESGFYDHGLYPVVFDVLYPEKNSPAGFGKIDIMRNPQQFIDNLSDEVFVNVKWNSRPRWLSKKGNGINMDDYLDIDKTVIEVDGRIDDDSLRQVDVKPIDPAIFSFIQGKIEELKETSGNRDFSQGSTSSGVTAGSAIAALMEAGSKLSRDSIKNTYTAHNDICYMVIELMRQFYTESRVFRITNDNSLPDENGEQQEQFQFVEFSNKALQPEEKEINGVIFSGRKPIFDIECKSQKASPFSKLAQNELAKEMYQLGFFNPQLADQALCALDMMEFEGKEQVLNKIAQNKSLLEQLQMAQMQVAQLSQMVAQLTGEMPVNGQMGSEMAQAPSGINSGMGDINSLGGEEGIDTRNENAREMVRQQTEVQ